MNTLRKLTANRDTSTPIECASFQYPENSRASSFGLLPNEVLQTPNDDQDYTNFSFHFNKDETFEFKKPFDVSTFEGSGLPKKYLQPTTPRPDTSVANDLSALYNTTTEVNSSAMENFDWASVFGQTPSNNSEKLKKAPSSPISKDPHFQPWNTILNSNSGPTFGSFGSNSFTMDDHEFGAVVKDNLALMNEEEKKAEVENQFVQHDAMSTNKTEAEAQIENDNEEVSEQDMTSKSQYFTSNSSRLGSLESSIVERPNLGLEKISSPPERNPVKLLEKTLNCSFSTKQKSDLKNIIMNMNNDQNGDDLKKYLKDLYCKNESKLDETVIPDAITSFLEMTQNFTTANESPRKSNIENSTHVKKQSKIVQRGSTPIKSTVKSNENGRTFSKGNEKTVHFLPEISTMMAPEENSLFNCSEGPTSASIMSSTSIQPDLAPLLGACCDTSVAPAISIQPSTPPKQIKQKTETFTSSEFPIRSDQLEIKWDPTVINENSERIVTLKNISDKKVNVILTIIESNEFIFKEKRKQEAQACFDPKATIPIPVLFIPLSVGEKSARLKVRVRGFKNDKGNSVSSKIPFHGMAKTQFHDMPLEETLEGTLMDVTNLNLT